MFTGINCLQVSPIERKAKTKITITIVKKKLKKKITMTITKKKLKQKTQSPGNS